MVPNAHKSANTSTPFASANAVEHEIFGTKIYDPITPSSRLPPACHRSVSG